MERGRYAGLRGHPRCRGTRVNRRQHRPSLFYRGFISSKLRQGRPPYRKHLAAAVYNYTTTTIYNYFGPVRIATPSSISTLQDTTLSIRYELPDTHCLIDKLLNIVLLTTVFSLDIQYAIKNNNNNVYILLCASFSSSVDGRRLGKSESRVFLLVS